MNKIQYIELLKLRGVTELRGESIADAMRRTGGDTSEKEMAVVNFNAMTYYVEQYKKSEDELKKTEDLLACARKIIDAHNVETYKLKHQLSAIETQLKERCPDAVDAKRLEYLQNWKNAMEAAGVDNWSGYEYAIEKLEERS
jgi:hypothetical protein